MSGAIPSELADIGIQLQSLFLHRNMLSGPIPDLSGLTGLWYLYLHENQLTGKIPASLGNLTGLYYLILSGNQLTGGIPSELGDLPHLYGLYLHRNQLSGEIPTDWGQLTSLTDLYLHSNEFHGTIPEELGSLTDLQLLTLSNNQLDGEIPEKLGDLKGLLFTRFAGNALTGCVPQGLSYLLEAADYRDQPAHDFTGVDANGDGDYDDEDDTPPLGLEFCSDSPTLPTQLSIVHSEGTLTNGVGVSGNRLSWTNQRCDSKGEPDDPIQYVWRIKYNGEVIEDAAIVTERDGRCIYAHTDYYDPPRWPNRFEPGVIHHYEVTTLRIERRVSATDYGYKVTEESPPATITECAADPRGVTDCWLGEDELGVTSVFARRHADGKVQITWDRFTNHGALFDNDELPAGESQYAVQVSGGLNTSYWALTQLTTVFGDPTGRGNTYTAVHRSSTSSNNNNNAFGYTLKLIGQPWAAGETFLKMECPGLGSASSVICYKVSH